MALFPHLDRHMCKMAKPLPVCPPSTSKPTSRTHAYDLHFSRRSETRDTEYRVGLQDTAMPFQEKLEIVYSRFKLYVAPMRSATCHRSTVSNATER